MGGGLSYPVLNFQCSYVYFNKIEKANQFASIFLNAKILNIIYVNIAQVNVANIWAKYTFKSSFFTKNSSIKAFIK